MGRGVSRETEDPSDPSLACSIIQTKSKFSQIQPNPAKPSQRISKKNTWISLDSLVRNEPFQSVMLTPWGKKDSFASPSFAVNLRAGCCGALPGELTWPFRMSFPAFHVRLAARPRRAAIEWKCEQRSMDLEKQKDNCA
jgi:hypothetical protein